MISLMHAALLVASVAVDGARAAPHIDCRNARIEILRSTKVLVNPEATGSTRADNDPQSVEFFLIPKIGAKDGEVSEDGQVIFLPIAATSGPNADENIGAALFAQAIDRRLVATVGDACTPLPQSPGAR